MVVDKHEFDLQVLYDNGRPGYAWLKPKQVLQPSPDLEKVSTKLNFLGYIFAGHSDFDPGKIIDHFIKELQKMSLFWSFF